MCFFIQRLILKSVVYKESSGHRSSHVMKRKWGNVSGKWEIASEKWRNECTSDVRKYFAGISARFALCFITVACIKMQCYDPETFIVFDFVTKALGLFRINV